ncbi:metallophosphoesterase family protein [Kordiimonas aestuarii]|uniref:metallophosphoesterase family protein n=1 Tax=Kordiimonas aestuarii TaxID=1005925 RepID=UPI0021D02871|nr:metallophosphoesterase [Kordiimonas aestuarii]
MDGDFLMSFMRLVHLSDLHFGTEEADVVEALVGVIRRAGPDLVVVSGDFTQVGSAREFRAARTFLESLGAPVLSVPGNHDIPRFNLWERFANPYKKYRKHIKDELCPVHEGRGVIVAGLNSARRALPHWNWANGAISESQLEYLAGVFEKSPAKHRVCVFHHPIHDAVNVPLDTRVFGARRAQAALRRLKVDVVLTGHVHHASVTTLGDEGHKTVYLSASTALSTRLRGQENGFNIVEICDGELDVQVFAKGLNGFEMTETHSVRI